MRVVPTLTDRPPRVQVAFERLEQDELPGSCTVCLAMLTATGQLHVLNIGDSGLHVVRDGVSVFQTNEQQHYFNCPFQLGMGSDDSPGDADYYVLEDLAEGDLIVAATDGVWDNVYEEEMLQLLYNPSTFNRPELMARTLSEASHSHGKDQTYTSPFAANAQRQGLRYVGGKLDDVTVIISRVCLPSDVAAPASPADTASSPVSSMDETGSEE
jgi:protein phosphatase PTC7